MARRTKEEAEETRALILRTALDVFAEKGYATTTFADITSRMNVTKGAIYWHFENKVAILAELIRMQNEHYEAMRIPEMGDSLALVQADLLDWARQTIEDEEMKRFFIFAMTRVEWSPELKAKLAEILPEQKLDAFERVQQRFGRLQVAGRMRSDLSPEQAMVLVRGIFFSTLRQVFFAQSEMDGMRTIEVGLSILVTNLGVQ